MQLETYLNAYSKAIGTGPYWRRSLDYRMTDAQEALFEALAEKRKRQASAFRARILETFNKVRCAYCGTLTSADASEVIDHIFTCPERPEVKLNAVIEDLAKQLDRATLALRQALQPESGDDLLAAMDTLKELVEGEP